MYPFFFLYDITISEIKKVIVSFLVFTLFLKINLCRLNSPLKNDKTATVDSR